MFTCWLFIGKYVVYMFTKYSTSLCVLTISSTCLRVCLCTCLRSTTLCCRVNRSLARLYIFLRPYMFECLHVLGMCMFYPCLRTYVFAGCIHAISVHFFSKCKHSYMFQKRTKKNETKNARKIHKQKTNQKLWDLEHFVQNHLCELGVRFFLETHLSKLGCAIKPCYGVCVQ